MGWIMYYNSIITYYNIIILYLCELLHGSWDPSPPTASYLDFKLLMESRFSASSDWPGAIGFLAAPGCTRPGERLHSYVSMVNQLWINGKPPFLMGN